MQPGVRVGGLVELHHFDLGDPSTGMTLGQRLREPCGVDLLRSDGEAIRFHTGSLPFVPNARRVFGCVLGVLAVMLPTTSARATDHAAGTVGVDGALLASPTAVVTQSLAPDQGCQVLLERGTGDCAAVDTANGQLVFTVEGGKRISTGARAWVVHVYRKSPTVADGWELALSTSPPGDPGPHADPGPLFGAVTAKIGDVTGDAKNELLVGYRSEGTSRSLAVDIIGTEPDGTPTVLAHELLDHGVVVERGGRLITFNPVYALRDANCCPTWIQRSIVQYRDGAFRVQAGPRVRTARAKVPESQLG